jgi:C4-dicarboxylate-specific signal transduction histidine kinase
VFDTVMGQGIVGGVLTDYQAIGRSTGRAALAALAGAPLDKLSTESADRSELRLDWRQVQRWDVAARLPAAAVIEFREPGLWPRYRWPIIGGAGLAALQVMVIGLLLLERRSRRRLQQSLDDAGQFERAMMAAHAGEVAVIDGSGAVIAANEAWQRGSAAPVGRSAAQASAQRGGPQAALASPAVASALRSVLSSDRAEAVVDVERESSEGRQWSEVRIQRLDRSGGGAVLSCLDISARKRAELQLREHLRGLSHLNMVAAVGEMAASVAHELNQPLTAVLSNAQALRRIIAAGEGDSPLAAEIVEDIIAQDKRAGEIITRIRRLLKKETIDWMPVDVNGLVGDVCHMFGGAGTPGSPSIALELAASLPVVRGDRVQLQQVVLNLVQNAQHAMRDADSLAASRVMVSTGAGDGGVHIAVRDHGAGIAADQIGRVFEPFFSTKHEGLGLGLAISRSIVELHGGNITARNRPEGGAEFLVRLPVEN